MHSKKHNLMFYSTKNKKVLKSSMTLSCVWTCVRNVQYKIKLIIWHFTTLSHYEWKKEEEEIIIHHTSTFKQCKNHVEKSFLFCSPLCPAALVFQSLAFRWACLDVFTRRCWTSLQVIRGLTDEMTKTFYEAFEFYCSFEEYCPLYNNSYFILFGLYRISNVNGVLDWVPLLPIWEALFVGAFRTLIHFSVTTAS